MIDKIKVHYFRQFNTDCGFPNCNYRFTHNNSPGMHGKNPKYCFPCVVAIVAVITNDIGTYVGVSIRSKEDQFNRKIGRPLAIERAFKNMQENKGFPLGVNDLAERIEHCYNNPTDNIRAIWKD